MNLLEKLILNLIRRKVAHWFDMERSLVLTENSLRANEWSPEKTWPDPEKIPLGGEVPFSLKNFRAVGPFLRSCVREGKLAITSLKENPTRPKQRIDPTTLEAFEDYAKTMGIGAIGYTRVPRRLIFRDRAILYENAVVLTMEMDRDKISKAPSLETFRMVFETYDSLGKTINGLCRYLREEGYSVQGGHPLGGLVLYPPLALKAGLGWPGYHGLLITPQFGPRQRIGAIFTNIQNLPISKSNPHDWIREFCRKCRRCIKRCPPGAIYDEAIVHESGRLTHISRDKCKPIFVAQQGCSVCIKVCPFSSGNYDHIRTRSIRSGYRKVS